MMVEKGNQTKSAIAKLFNVPKNTLSGWLKHANEIKEGRTLFGEHRKLMRYGNFDQLESLLVKWITAMRDRSVQISGSVVLDQATAFANKLGITNFKHSAGWLDRFKYRHNISFRTGFAEPKYDYSRTNWEDRFYDVIDRYEADDIYNADETAILFSLVPDGTLEIKSEFSYEDEISDNRLTVLACSNMTGCDKLPLVVVGKSAHPACFKGVQTFPIQYESNPNSWMTGEIFSNWVLKIDKQMKDRKRRIAMIIDSSPAHPMVKDLKAVELIYLPETRNTQPMSEGIIRSLKCNYKKLVIMKQLEMLDKFSCLKVSVLDALYLLQLAWKNVTESTISNAFRLADVWNGGTVHNDELVEDMPETELAKLGVVDIERFFNADVDSSIPTCAETVEDDIMNAVEHAEQNHIANNDVEEDVEVKNPPTMLEALEACSTLRSFFQCKDESEAELDIVSTLYSRLVKEDFIQRSSTQTGFYS